MKRKLENINDLEELKYTPLLKKRKKNIENIKKNNINKEFDFKFYFEKQENILNDIYNKLNDLNKRLNSVEKFIEENKIPKFKTSPSYYY